MFYNDPLWVEKYRPAKIDDCILPDNIRKSFKELLSKNTLDNLLLVGPPGCGKTSAAKALCNELNCEYLLINGSEENGIDVLRSKIRQFASTISMGGSMKVVILDEADYLSAATQPALRGFIEEFSANCRFIFTCNYKNKIIEPLHSRCAVIEFSVTKGELAKLASKFMKRISHILREENVEFDQKILAELIIKYAPDWRRVINECKRHSTNGKLEVTALLGVNNTSELITYLRDKDFKKMRSWVVANSNLDGLSIFRQIYDGAYDYIEPASIPSAVLILADYSYKSSFMADKELNLVAALTELMGSVTFKS